MTRLITEFILGYETTPLLEWLGLIVSATDLTESASPTGPERTLAIAS